MLDYKSILVKRFALGLSGAQIAKELGCSKPGVNDFLKAFGKCKELGYPLPKGITNDAIYLAVYGRSPSNKGTHEEGYTLPDFAPIHESMKRPNMTLFYQWGVYRNACNASSAKHYSYRRFCVLYQEWCSENGVTSHFEHSPGQTMEVDFAGKTFKLFDFLTGELSTITVFVAVLPYSQYVYAEGMTSIKQPQWIQVNNNALEYFGGAPQIVVCDNCKQAVLANADWIDPELNRDYAEWAEHNGTVIVPAKVRKPRYKPSVEGAVGIMEKGFFHDLENILWPSLEEFNDALIKKVGELNSRPFAKKEHSREYYFGEEKKWLLPLPRDKYQYAERREATVSSDFHIRFDNAYYSCPSKHVHKKVTVRATPSEVKILDALGSLICSHPRATRRGQWVTDPSHIPASQGSFKDWSPDFFRKGAALIGPSTSAVVEAVLLSKKYQVQTYRSCKGILSFADKYGPEALESACAEALRTGRVSYNSIKCSLQSAERAPRPAKDKNRNAYIAKGLCSDAKTLVQKTVRMMETEGDKNE